MRQSVDQIGWSIGAERLTPLRRSRGIEEAKCHGQLRKNTSTMGWKGQVKESEAKHLQKETLTPN